MELNLKKCKSMTFARYSAKHNKYCINGVELSVEELFLDLGVLFDKKLNFNAHVTMTVNKANGILCFIKRWAKEFNDPYVTKKLYISLVRPILEYASVIWDPQYNVYINKIESVQKQFLLFCLRTLRWNPDIVLPPYRSRLALLSLSTLKTRRIISNIMFFLNLIHGNIDSSNLLAEININIPNRHLRSYVPLHVFFNRSNYANFDPLRRICAEINEYYNIIDFSNSITESKKKLLNYFNSNDYS